MQDELLTPLHRIDDAAQSLLESTYINFAQEQLLKSVHAVTQQLMTLVIATPDLTWDKARELLSFEARGYLASIIGYAEMLLDESEGQLDEAQRAYAHQIRADGKSLLARLIRLENA